MADTNKLSYSTQRLFVFGLCPSSKSCPPTMSGSGKPAAGSCTQGTRSARTPCCAESDDYDVPLSELAGGKPTSKPAAAAASDDSEDEDVPLGSLAKTPKTTPKPSKTKDAAKSPSSKTPSSKTPSSKGTKRSRDAASTSSKASSTSKAPRLGSVLSEGGVRILDKSLPLKEQAVEAILVRWQHVPDLQSAWPPVKAAEYPVPDSFRPLKGFLGVFVGVDDAENLGVRRSPVLCRNASPLPSCAGSA